MTPSPLRIPWIHWGWTPADVEHFFMYMLAFYMCSLEKKKKNVCSGLLLILNFSLMFSWVSHLYIFDMKCLSVISFVNIFSHLINCSFILSMVSFAVEKKINLIRSNLFIFLLYSLPEEKNPNINIAMIFVSTLPMFSSRSFVVQTYI